MKSINKKNEAIRFLLAGGANSIITYLVYLALLNVFGYLISFTFSFAAGIVFAFVTYSKFVFYQPHNWKRLPQYSLLYLMQYVIGLALLFFLVTKVALDERIAPIINVIILTPITFLLNRWFIVKRVD